MKCPNCCRGNLSALLEQCVCGWNFPSNENAVSSKVETTSKKYAALNAYSGIIRIFGWILLILGVFAFIVGLLSASRGDLNFDSILGLASGIGIVVAGLGTVAMGQLICVWADTEENTRRIVELLEKNNK